MVARGAGCYSFVSGEPIVMVLLLGTDHYAPKLTGRACDVNALHWRIVLDFLINRRGAMAWVPLRARCR